MSIGERRTTVSLDQRGIPHGDPRLYLYGNITDELFQRLTHQQQKLRELTQEVLAVLSTSQTEMNSYYRNDVLVLFTVICGRDVEFNPLQQTTDNMGRAGTLLHCSRSIFNGIAYENIKVLAFPKKGRFPPRLDIFAGTEMGKLELSLVCLQTRRGWTDVFFYPFPTGNSSAWSVGKMGQQQFQATMEEFMRYLVRS